jgi:hypothetical protein
MKSGYFRLHCQGWDGRTSSYNNLTGQLLNNSIFKILASFIGLIAMQLSFNDLHELKDNNKISAYWFDCLNGASGFRVGQIGAFSDSR